IFAVLLFLAILGLLYKGSDKEKAFGLHFTAKFTPGDILSVGNGVMFVETTDRMEPPHLVLCSIESAARAYPDRPVVFFMKGLTEINSEEDEIQAKKHFPTLLSYDNIHLYPLRMGVLLKNTPLISWYEKIKPKNEIHWTHISSDASRLALIYKFGGLYMDTDMISLRPVPDINFLAAESSQISSNGVFGFASHHPFIWTCMEDFVKNYNGAIWGHQGPALFTRVLQERYCTLFPFEAKEDILCGNISFLNPERFYPIPCSSWKKYFEVWEELPVFNESYALHLFNYANRDEHKVMIPGSNTLVEHLYQQYCPATYQAVQEKEQST
ncbi:hypothetical protein XENTR_v10014875, partial [Xenopus tropicalis]